MPFGSSDRTDVGPGRPFRWLLRRMERPSQSSALRWLRTFGLSNLRGPGAAELARTSNNLYVLISSYVTKIVQKEGG